MKSLKQKPIMQLYIDELIELKDNEALRLIRADIINGRQIELMHYKDQEYVKSIDMYFDENNLRKTLTEIEEKF